MKGDIIIVSSNGSNMDRVLKETEKVAAYKELSKKSALHLRLLTEEMLGMMRSITGTTEGCFWIEDEDNDFRLHLQVESQTDFEQREKLLTASKSGKNEAAKGFMGKIRSFFEPVEGVPLFIDPALDPTGAYLMWSMRTYQEQLAKEMAQKREGASEAWDELEKSVVSHVADDIKVSISGRLVEMVICKKIDE